MTASQTFELALGIRAAINNPIRQWDDFARLLQKALNQLDNFIRNCPPVSPASKTVFFGAGGHGQYLLKACRALGRQADYFCDNDLSHTYFPWMQNIPRKQRTRIDGVYVLSPEELPSLGRAEIVVATSSPRFRREIRAQIHDLGLQEMAAPGRYFYEAVMLKSYADFYSAHFESLRQVHDSLSDARSRLVYLSLLKARLVSYEAAENIYQDIMEGEQYWLLPEFRDISPDTVFIDAGAFSGDTISRFIQHNVKAGFKKIHAFEPDAQLYDGLRRTAEKLTDQFKLSSGQIECVNSGLGCSAALSESGRIRVRSEKMPLSAPQTMTLPEMGSLISLDEYLNGDDVGLIKADIEGFEMDLINGASGSIQKHRPHLAISVYHLPDDIFTIPLACKKLVPQYKMALRHHSGWPAETVLYCWV